MVLKLPLVSTWWKSVVKLMYKIPVTKLSCTNWPTNKGSISGLKEPSSSKTSFPRLTLCRSTSLRLTSIITGTGPSFKASPMKNRSTLPIFTPLKVTFPPSFKPKTFSLKTTTKRSLLPRQLDKPPVKKRKPAKIIIPPRVKAPTRVLFAANFIILQYSILKNH